MDIEALKQGLSAIAAILGMLKQAKDLLPDGKNKEEIADQVEKAERQMQTAEIQIAKILGHEICTNHWPSGIMLSADKKHWKCPMCGNEIKPQKPQSTKHPASGIEIL
ncbi:hypothetical protein ANAEL_05580 [Anaerolineales bacterium]|nr:hypothetical protein ANAEL_05580 [Anaerolineales bacterium]